MLRLYILRHAKSSWALPGISDFDRGLNNRGTKDIKKIARSMIAHSYFPDQIYSSSSNRTSTTIREIKDHILENIPETESSPQMPIEYADCLYSGTLDNYLNVMRAHPDNRHSLMLVGHNPTCHSLASSLIADGVDSAIAALDYNFPTGALAVIDLNSDKWADVSEKNGYLRNFILPRELPAT